MENTVKVAEVHYTLVGDYGWSLHLAGCKDIKEDALKHVGAVYHKDITSRQEAFDWVLDEETREMGYSESHIKINPCFDRAFRELNARTRESEVRNGGSGVSITPYLSFHELVEAMCMAIVRSRYTADDIKAMGKEDLDQLVGRQVALHGTSHLSGEWKAYLDGHSSICDTIIPMAEELIKYTYFDIRWTDNSNQLVNAFYSVIHGN